MAVNVKITSLDQCRIGGSFAEERLKAVEHGENCQGQFLYLNIWSLERIIPSEGQQGGGSLEPVQSLSGNLTRTLLSQTSRATPEWGWRLKKFTSMHWFVNKKLKSSRENLLDNQKVMHYLSKILSCNKINSWELHNIFTARLCETTFAIEKSSTRGLVCCRLQYCCWYLALTAQEGR